MKNKESLMSGMYMNRHEIKTPVASIGEDRGKPLLAITENDLENFGEKNHRDGVGKGILLGMAISGATWIVLRIHKLVKKKENSKKGK